MEPLRNPNERAPHINTYTPNRSRWPGLLGAAAIVAAVLGVTMWAQHDDARKIDAPLDKRANATAPAQPGADSTRSRSSVSNDSAAGGNAGSASNDASKVATQPPPARQ
ncbi:MAG TPA: hypothetical protein VLJ62_02160 [Burkholderiaceae bacterium]|nr:hypothetical protein [Burkholderiaceae bacterium]